MNVTESEFAVLRGIDKSDFGDVLNSGAWTFDVAEKSGVNGKSLSGVSSSLVTKGLVFVGDAEGNGKARDLYIGMTREGFETYTTECATRNLKVEKDFDWS